MHIANCRSWEKVESTSEGRYLTSPKLKATTKCGNPKLLAEFVKSYWGWKVLTPKFVPWRV